MRYVFIALILILGFFAFVLFSRMKITIEYREKKLKIILQNILLKFTMDSAWFDKISGKRKSKKQAENIQTENEEHKRSSEEKTDDGKEKETFLTKAEGIKENYRAVKEVLDTFIRCMKYRIEFSGIYIRVVFGTGDAADTGVLYGAVWGVIGNLYSFLCRSFYISFPDVELQPEFDRKVFEAEAEGIITVRPVHIIIAVIRSLKIYQKHKKKLKGSA